MCGVGRKAKDCNLVGLSKLAELKDTVGVVTIKHQEVPMKLARLVKCTGQRLKVLAEPHVPKFLVHPSTF